MPRQSGATWFEPHPYRLMEFIPARPIAPRGFASTLAHIWLFGLVALVCLSLPARAAELVMFEEAGCGWCKKWNEEIGVVYDRTYEGQRAPLRRVDVNARRPSDIAHIRVVNFTPTFVLVEDGKEYGRILGYPGEDFFWPLLNDLLAKLPSTEPPRESAPLPLPQPIRLQP